MSRVLPNAFERRNVQRMANDPAYLNHVAMSNFGMDAATLESVLHVMMSVSQGSMPESQHMQTVYQQARQKFGWGQDRVQAEMRKAISQASPQERVAAYLSANNMERVDPKVYRRAIDLVQHGLRGDLEYSIQNRLAEGNSVNSPDRPFEGMAADQRVLDDAQDKASLRATLETLSGHNSKPTYNNRLDRVLKARSQLADRVEIKAQARAAGQEPTLRESLADSYDEKFVAAASEDLGLGNPIAEARETVEAESAHLSEGHDVTADLRD